MYLGQEVFGIWEDFRLEIICKYTCWASFIYRPLNLKCSKSKGLGYDAYTKIFSYFESFWIVNIYCCCYYYHYYYYSQPTCSILLASFLNVRSILVSRPDTSLILGWSTFPWLVHTIFSQLHLGLRWTTVFSEIFPPDPYPLQASSQSMEVRVSFC